MILWLALLVAVLNLGFLLYRRHQREVAHHRIVGRLRSYCL